jgi:hypothetical protein
LGRVLGDFEMDDSSSMVIKGERPICAAWRCGFARERLAH